MTKKVAFFSLFSFCLLSACNNSGKEVSTTNDMAIQATTGTKKVNEIEPALIKADSLQVLFYDNPDGDSLRYTRFYTYTETKDTTQLKTLVQEINRQVFVQETRMRPCRSEGKFYLLDSEDILKTIYFSTRGDSCTYFYFIKDGSFIYFPLTEGAQKILSSYRRISHKPKASY